MLSGKSILCLIIPNYLPVWRTDLNEICGVGCQSSDRQADGKETADAVDAEGSTFAFTSEDQGPRW